MRKLRIVSRQCVPDITDTAQDRNSYYKTLTKVICFVS